MLNVVPLCNTYATPPVACTRLNEYVLLLGVTLVHAPVEPSRTAKNNGMRVGSQNCH